MGHWCTCNGDCGCGSKAKPRLTFYYVPKATIQDGYFVFEENGSVEMRRASQVLSFQLYDLMKSNPQLNMPFTPEEIGRKIVDSSRGLYDIDRVLSSYDIMQPILEDENRQFIKRYFHRESSPLRSE